LPTSSSTTLERLDEQLKAMKRRITDALVASKTTLTELFGVGPIVACLVVGYSGDMARFASRHDYAAYNGTAPVEMSSGGRVAHRLSRRGNRRLNYAIHMAAVAQIRHLDSEGRASSIARSPRARRRWKRFVRSSVASATPRTASSFSTLSADKDKRAREDTQGTSTKPARPALTLISGSSAQSLPGPSPTLRR